MSAHIDFETRSTVNLPKTTTAVYAADPTTEVLCMAWAIGDAPVRLWRPGHKMPRSLWEHIESGGLIYAHNCAFEFEIWNQIMAPRFDWPVLTQEQCRCTMAMAYAMSLPGNLAGASAALGISQQKDDKGHRLMLKMCKPRQIKDDGTIIWWESKEDLDRLHDYCRQDVEVERELHRRLVNLPETEWKTWHLDQEINRRGIPVDLESIDAMIALVGSEKKRLDQEMKRVTGGMVKQCTWVSVLTDWLRFNGVETPGVAKADIRTLLDRKDVPTRARKALRLRQEAAKSSTAKLETMRRCASSDARVKGTMQYHGSSTGRWAGRKIQPVNYPWSLPVGDMDDAIDLVHRGERDLLELMYGNPMEVASKTLRGMIAAPAGREFTCSDFSNIEGRLIAWLADESWKVQAFRDFDAGIGADAYKRTYAKSFGKRVDGVTKDERQVGKTMELFCGFQGGVGAAETMSAMFGLDFSDHYDTLVHAAGSLVHETALEAYQARGKDSGIPEPRWVASEMVKIVWRDAHPNVVNAWHSHERAAIDAVENTGSIFNAGQHIKFKKAGSFLFCRLPSGRCLCYPYPQIEERETPWGAKKPALTHMRVHPITGKWERHSTYGGNLFQSSVQGCARDVLRDAMLRLTTAGIEIVFTVHDEIVAEGDTGAVSFDEFNQIMAETPTWAPGLPIAVDGWQGRRYRK